MWQAVTVLNDGAVAAAPAGSLQQALCALRFASRVTPTHWEGARGMLLHVRMPAALATHGCPATRNAGSDRRTTPFDGPFQSLVREVEDRGFVMSDVGSDDDAQDSSNHPKQIAPCPLVLAVHDAAAIDTLLVPALQARESAPQVPTHLCSRCRA